MVKKIFALLLFTPGVAFTQQSNINVSIEPRIELLTVIQHLADRGVWAAPSSYLSDVNQWFKPYKKELAVQQVKAMMDKKMPDAAYPSTAMYFTKLPEFTQYLPLSGTDSAKGKNYLQSCKAFYNASDFVDFIDTHQSQFSQWAKDVTDTIVHYQLTNRLEAFMGQPRSWNIFLSPLVGWGAYNFVLPTATKDAEIYFVLGYTKWKKEKNAMDLQPFFADKATLVNLVWHEGAHSYITPLIKKDSLLVNQYSYLLRDSMQVPLQMAGRFQWKWDYYLNELLVRTITARLITKYFSAEEGEKEFAKQRQQGFIYIDRVNELFNNYEQRRSEMPTINSFWMTLLEDLKSWH